MTQPILATKLYAPPPRPNWVARARLLSRLDEGQTRPLTLIAAPPGFGKTALAGSWLAQRQPAAQAAWLSLEPADDEPVRFWRYVLAALQTARPGLGQTAPALLAAPGSAPLEAVAAGLVNDLAADPQPLTLVLDDYHTIASEAIHASLNFLLDHAPPAWHLVLLTREDPPLALARRRARQQVVEVRAADLRFTDAEVAAFLNTANGLGLAPADVATLAARTEGWIVGLQMAALLLEGHADRHRLVASFAGDDRFIADYLIEEVLQRQPPALQEFLLKTALLPRLCGPLCDAVLDDGPAAPHARRPAALVLEELERANLFLIPLDNRREWYRYHHLFADLLQSRLAQALGPEAVRGLRQRASAWFHQQGLVPEAVRELLLSGDTAAAARLLAEVHVWFFVNNALPELAALAQALPAEVLAAHPALCFAYGWAALATTDLTGATRAMTLLEQALGCTPAALSPELPAQLRASLLEIMIIRAQVAIGQNHLEEALALCQAARPYLTGPDAEQTGFFNSPANLEPVVVYNLAFLQETHGETAAAIPVYAEARRLAEARNNPHLLAITAGRLGQVLLLHGQRRAAEAAFEQELQRLAAAGQAATPLAAVAQAGLGSAQYERGDLEAARFNLQAAYDLARTWRNSEGLLAAARGLARLRLAGGDPAGAAAILDEAAAFGQPTPATSAVFEAARAVVWARQGRLEAAEAWARTLSLDLAAPLTYLDEEIALDLARVRLAQGHWEAAVRWLKHLEASAAAGQRHGRLIEVSVLQALVLNAQGRPAEALAALGRALALAEPEGYTRVFVDEGQALPALLKAISGPSAGYAGRLLALCAGPAASPPPLPTAVTLAEPLTPREVEVLRL
ncbi:MAG: hypothetical protein JNK29_01740, partial [Anaerolineales bacterium]|nr:hypothetical protein [Anaerolineales bacterium]